MTGVASTLKSGVLSRVDWALSMVRTTRSARAAFLSTNATSITNLPTELLEIVGGDLDRADLCFLRLVSRELSEKVLATTFTRTCFSKKGFLMFSLADLETLLHIAQHPTFGPELREIRFYVDMMWSPQKHPEAPGGFGPYVDWLQGERQEKVYEDQQKFEDQVATLTRIFQQLDTHKKPRKIVLTSITADYNPYVRQHRFPLRTICYNDLTSEGMHRLEFTLGLLPENSFGNLWTLGMEGQEVTVCTRRLHQHRVGTLSHTMLNTNIFEQCSSISLVLQSSRTMGGHGMFQLLAVLGKNTALTSLDLHFKGVLRGSGWNSDRTLDSCSALTLLALRFSSLKTLKVKGLQADLTTIADCIGRNPALKKFTLVELAAIGIKESEIGAWATVINGGGHALTMVKNALGFEALESEDMRDAMLYQGVR